MPRSPINTWMAMGGRADVLKEEVIDDPTIQRGDIFNKQRRLELMDDPTIQTGDILNKPRRLEFTFEQLNSSSNEFIIHDIRFGLFNHIDKSQLKKLFMDMVNTPLKNPEIMDKFMNHLNEANFNSVAEFVKKNVLSTEIIDTVLNNSNPKFIHNFDKIFDIYLSIDDPDIAIGVLRYLIFRQCENQTEHDNVLKSMKSHPDSVLKHISNSYVWNAEII